MISFTIDKVPKQATISSILFRERWTCGKDVKKRNDVITSLRTEGPSRGERAIGGRLLEGCMERLKYWEYVFS